MPSIPAPTSPDLSARLAVAESTRIALASELASVRRELWREQVLRRHPALEDAVGLIPATDDEATFKSHAATLAAYIDRPRN